MDKNISFLQMDKLFFNEISFVREGVDRKEDSHFDFDLETTVSTNPEGDSYKVNLKMIGSKEDEYKLVISLIGIFSFVSTENLDDKLKIDLISKNTVSIMMPYLRSQVSLITAQPGVECVVLPPFNINNMINSEKV